MASFHISPPEIFNFTQDDWPKWARRLKRYRQGSGLKAKSEEHQVNALIYIMGDKEDDILCSFGLTEDEKKVYTIVRAKFDSYFEPQRNVIFQRAKFNQRKQHQGEPVDNFITDLYCLADHCEYGKLRNEMIRDRIVGLLDDTLSEKLQLDTRLTLETAVTIACQSEEVHKRQTVVRGKATDLNTDFVDKIHSSGGVNKKKFVNKGGNTNPRGQSSLQHKQDRCSRCVKTPSHSRRQCPAREAICHRCHKKGHYQSMCRTLPKQSIQSITSEVPEGFSDQFLGVVTDSTNHSNLWNATVMLNGKAVEFKLDTGANVSVIPTQLFESLKIDTTQPTEAKLTGAGSQPLAVQGKFEANLQNKARSSKQTVYVASTLSKPLLGKPAIESLNLISRVDIVDKDSCKANYPELFTGLGLMTGEYKIRLKPDSTPYAITTPRRVALLLIPKVKDELKRMQSMGVITKINEPTEWCAGIVAVPKPNNKIRICMDLTKLNESVCRERHILPSVNHTLAQLSGATVFSKLDANSGFWQINLVEESRRLTTFITPFGRYYFNRLPFGITSAPEYFQRNMSQILEGLDGVVCMMDDILIYGCT